MNVTLGASGMGAIGMAGTDRCVGTNTRRPRTNARALSLNTNTNQTTYAFDASSSSEGGNGGNGGDGIESNGANKIGMVQRRQGESCEWPRACEWPMKERRDAAASAMSDAAAAAALSNSIEWTPEAKVYTMNEEIDADLPPDVELLAYFSDNPMSWRAREGFSEEEDGAGEEESSGPMWTKAVGKWFSKMWRYQGLG